MGGCKLPVMIAAAVLWSIVAAPSAAAPHSSKPRNVAELVKMLIRKNSKNTEIVTFANRRLPSVRVVRGKTAAAPPAVEHGKVETVAFFDKRMKPVRIVRGVSKVAAAEISLPAVKPPQRVHGARIELVAFADPREQPVTILRGAPVAVIDTDLPIAAGSGRLDLFSAARGADLDRVAFAVDAAESSHGTDPGMWRPEFGGPQGPMQVSAAAAFDSGGGDRFDLIENRRLGRAYLARLYRRYGNWPDAIAAYNWGPGNMDAWIGNGRPGAGLPLEVERYRDRVLRDGGVGQMPDTRLSHAIRQARGR
jgi:Transglycosylase SLT domain